MLYGVPQTGSSMIGGGMIIFIQLFTAYKWPVNVKLW